MARYVYNAALVQNTIDTLHSAVDSLETTDATVEKGIEMIMYANGAEVMDIDFSQITNYHIQVIEYIDAMTNELRRKSQEIEEYQNAPWYKKVFSTIGLSALKLIEGLGTFVENIGDGVVAITGFVGGIFSSDFKDACGEAIKKDIVGDAFSNAYTEGWLKNVNKYSAMSHESTGANVFKGFGVAAGYVAISLVTGGSSLAVEIGVEAGLAGVTGIGAGTQEGLQEGKSYNQAFAQGVKTGAVAAAGEAIMGYGINKLMKVKEVQDAIGTAITSVKKAKTKVTSIFRKNTDTIASALKNSDEVASVAKNAGNSLISTSASKTFKMSDEIAAIAGKTDDVADTVYDAKKALVAADDAVDTVKKFDSVATKADEVVSSTAKASETIIKTSDDVATLVATKADDVVASVTKASDNVVKASDEVAAVVATKADDAAQLALPGKQQPLALPAGASDQVVKIGDDVAEVVKTPTKPNINDYGNVGMYGTKADDAVSYQKSLHNARNGSAGSGEWQESVAKLADTYGTGKGGQNLDVSGLNEFNAAEKSAAFHGKQLIEGNAKSANAYIENLAQISGYGDDFNDFIADEALRYATDKSASEMAGSALGAMGKAGTSLGAAGLSLIDDIPLPGNIIKNIAQAGVGSSDNIIRAGINSVDDAIKMGDDIAAVTNKTAKNIDEIPRGRNADGTYRLTKDEIIQDDLAKAKPKDTTYRLTKDQIIQDDIAAVEDVVTKAADAVDVIEEVAAHTDEAAKGAKSVVKRTDEAAENAKSVVAKTDEASEVVEEISTHTDEAVDVVEEVATHTDEAAKSAKSVAAKTNKAANVVEEVATHTDEVADVSKAVAKNTDEVVDVVEEVATHTDEVADASKAVVKNTDEVVDVVEEVATHTDEVTDVSKAVAKNTDEVADVVEEIATYTDEAADISKAVAKNTDEVVDVVEEVATHTDEVTDVSKAIAKNTDEVVDVVEEVSTHTDEVVGSVKSVVAKTDEVADVVEEIATHTDEGIESFEEIVDESAKATKLSNNVAEKIDEITDAAKSVIPHVDESARIVSSVAVHSDEVANVIEEIATHTDEAADVSKAVVKNTDEVVDVVEEVSTKTDDIVPMRRELESQLDDINLQKQALSENIENLQKQSDELQSEIASREVRKQRIAEQYSENFSAYNYARRDVINLIDELAPNGIQQLRPGVVNPNNSLAQAIADYFDQGTRIMNNGVGKLDATQLNIQLKRWLKSYELDIESSSRIAKMSGQYYDAARRTDEVISEYKRMFRKLEDYTKSINNTAPAAKQIAKISDEITGLRADKFSIDRKIRQSAKQFKDLSNNADEIMSQLDNLSTKTVNAVEEGAKVTSNVTETTRAFGATEDLFGVTKQSDDIAAVVGKTSKTMDDSLTSVINHTDEVADAAKSVARNSDEVLDVVEETITHTDEVVDATKAVARNSDEVLDVVEETITHTDEVADAAKAVARNSDEVLDVVEETITHTDEVADAAKAVARNSDEVVNVVEEAITHTDEVADATKAVARNSDEVVNVVEEAITHTDEVADATKAVARNTDEVFNGVEETITHTDETGNIANSAKIVDNAATSSDEVFASSGKITSEAAETVKYVEETSLFGNKEGAKNFFRRANNVSDAVTSTPVMTEIQQQWVDYINYNISIGNRVTVPFNSTSELSSVMLSKIDDLSQVDIQLYDGLGNGAGSLKAKYNHPRYMQRVTYSGHEMNAIINRLEDLQSRIDMSLPPSQRAKQIYDILGSEVPVMRDYNAIPNGHEISASLRGLTPVNSAGKEGLVCAGYSSAYKELCERAGIPCDYVRGSTISDPLKGNASSNHAWNVVHTEIGDIPVDVTWYACSNGTNNWFGASEQFSLKHFADVDEVCRDYSSMVSKYNFEPAGTKLDNVVSTLEQKYGSRQEALSRLEQYVSTGDANVITRTNDARNMILTTESADVQNYVYYARQNDNIQQIVDTMNYKYGNSSSGYKGLREYVNTGNPNCITRTNGARDMLGALDVDWLNQYLTAMGW